MPKAKKVLVYAMTPKLCEALRNRRVAKIKRRRATKWRWIWYWADRIDIADNQIDTALDAQTVISLPEKQIKKHKKAGTP